MGAKLKTAVLGATGYSGLELTRLLARHAHVGTPLLLRRGSQPESAGQFISPANGNGHSASEPTQRARDTQAEVAASCKMNAIRSRGQAPSMGTYPAPHFIAASMATMA